MQAVGLPQKVLITMNSALYTFIWKKKTSNRKAFEKEKRKVLVLNTEEGGLKMIDMITLQKSTTTAVDLKTVNKERRKN